jgi:hypothetical protein
MRWVGDETVRFGAHLLEQAEQLRGQLASEPDGAVEAPPPGGVGGWGFAAPTAQQRAMIRAFTRLGR